jgi:two-component system cell cycle sensor histidine kinase/response regulator CckA
VQDRPSPEDTIALLRATLDATHDGILVVDRNRRVLHYNGPYLAMFGFTAEAIDRGGLDFIVDALSPQIEDVDRVLEASRTMWANPGRSVLDVVRFRDGRVFERSVAPYRVGGEVFGYVASFRDIGQFVRATEALEQHRAFLETAQEVAHIGSWVAEMDGSKRLGWSAETCKIFGVPIGRFEGTHDAFYAFVHPDDREPVHQATAAALRAERPYAVEHRITRADGTMRWLHEQATIVRDADGQPIRMVGTVQDITERRQLEDQLRQSQKMEAIGRLAGGIAHDLNNALTAIAGYAELALGVVAAGHAARSDIEEIRRATERAGSVTRQLLAFSRKQLLEPRIFDLNATVTSLTRMLGRLLGPDIAVHASVADNLPRIMGDPGQIEQAVINLAVNARDAMPHGGRLQLTTAVEEVDAEHARTQVPMTPGRYVVLRVSDAGQGMSRETQAHIFEPFFTTKDVGKGTGLGLSMVYGTMKQIGGFIFVDSELGQGTTFRMYFPPAAEPQPVTPPAGPAIEHGRRGRETLMVVEDEPAVRNLVASALRPEGYTLLLATSAEEALQIADAHDGPLDLLLTDSVMPGKSGMELAHAMRQRRPGLPIIVMSGYTEETLTVGSVDEPLVLLQKPFSPRDLRQRIRDRLDLVGRSKR